jgi:hypothetical protein
MSNMFFNFKTITLPLDLLTFILNEVTHVYKDFHTLSNEQFFQKYNDSVQSFVIDDKDSNLSDIYFSVADNSVEMCLTRFSNSKHSNPDVLADEFYIQTTDMIADNNAAILMTSKELLELISFLVNNNLTEISYTYKNGGKFIKQK